MRRHELIADALRGSYWFHTAGQGDAYWAWEELGNMKGGKEHQEFWLAIARTFENRIEREGYEIFNVSSKAN